MTNSEKKEKVLAAVSMIKAVADAIKELKRVPSGRLYASMMNIVSIQDYEKIIGMLKGSNLIVEINNEIIWNLNE